MQFVSDPRNLAEKNAGRRDGSAGRYGFVVAHPDGLARDPFVGRGARVAISLEK